MKQITVIKLLVMHCWSETIRVIYSRFEIAEFSLPILFDLVAVLLKSRNKKALTSHFVPETEMMQYRAKKMVRFNPSSPNIHIQILQTYLYTFPLRIS